MYITKVWGPPGTGKTTRLLKLLEVELKRGVDPGRIAFLTHTKAAAEVAAERVKTKFDWFRTLHSACVKRLSIPRESIVDPVDYRAFSQATGLLILSERADGLLDDGAFYRANNFGPVLRAYDLARLTGRSLYEVCRTMPTHPSLAPARREAFIEAWEAYKKSNGLFDFTDMLQAYIDSDIGSVPCDVFFLDESQDLSELQWKVFDKMIAHAKRVYIAGDDDQCHPPGTQILTSNRGYVPIEALRSNDLLVEYEAPRSQMIGVRTGYSFTRTTHHYAGELVHVNGVPSTLSHKWLVQWKKKDGYAVYIMRRGHDFRVGWCQMFRADGCLHLAVRKNLERADDMWVLKTFSDKQGASFYEQEISLKYGIPTAPFREITGSATLYTQKALDDFFDRIRGQARHVECLEDHSRREDLPLLSGNNKYKHGSTRILVHASNLMDEWFRVPRYSGTQVSWEDARISRTPYSGVVYGIEAPPHHLYVANGLITHNSIYTFMGGSEDGFLRYKANTEEVLQTSYRVPRRIGDRADRIIRCVKNRKEKAVKWRDDDGDIHHVNLGPAHLPWDSWQSQYKDILVLARHRKGAAEISRALTSIGRPHALGNFSLHNSPEAKVIRDYILVRRGEKIGWRRMVKLLEAAGRDAESVRSTGTSDKKLELGRDVKFPWDDDEWLFLFASTREKLARCRNIQRLIQQEGVEVVGRDPQIMVMTMHAAKGRQAELVVISPDCNETVYRNLLLPSEARLAYVALTRALKQVVVLAPRSNRWITHLTGA